MRQWLVSLIVAFQFLTRLPIPVLVEYDKRYVSRSVLFYPVVGFVIGSILYLASLALPPGAAPLHAAVLLLLWTLLTGGLHLDGLMDTADGLGSHRPRELMLAIMKDSRVGAMGVLAAFFVLLIKWASLWTLLDRVEQGTLSGSLLLTLLLTVPAVSRGAMVAAIIRRPYIGGEQGMGGLFRDAHAGYLAGALLLLLFPFILRPSFGWLGLFGVQAAAAWLFVRHCVRRLGGLTGDTYGALNELAETAGLLAAVYISF
ncbi:adenosylcobinamide-phosphate synthase/adenosylcobinamide-GDP ribazoletransferase [Paenibacillus forsythiae]|uniref:Adenosylcobinamide-GDP ribazoletransferase n=2 Tax=Paenibacillus forsythiae TaxID=365616 RepID=A0ABU3HDQ1_9BACL|nr:adenosylcobinamide-GDP ribazoletransferase [Paenibacillus forsythiae]MDT3428928.1 adenosylcobinamide-phosphate synthase/adenosylcobinamide-GDP ribazoletransferase [Paenibacillus forsythiae]